MSTDPQLHERAHPTPLMYVVVGVVLAVVTAVEVWAVYLDALQDVLVPLLLVLSAMKFALVVLFFMHLKFDSRLFTAMFTGGVVLAVSVSIALMALFKVFAD